MPRILIVDDDAHIADSLRERIEARGHDVRVAGTVAAGVQAAERDAPDIVLLDLMLPDGDGVQALGQMRAKGVESTVIVITAYGTVDRAVAAMRAGAYDFVLKPFDPGLLEETIRRAAERSTLKRRIEAETRTEPFVVEDPKMKRALEQVDRAAASDATILLLGESGTGKELLARRVHSRSNRAVGPFVVVNCVAVAETLLESELFGHEKGAFTGAAGLKRGKVELADGGTLFLDEIGDISAAFQAKLLRLLQERTFERVGSADTRRVDVRFVAATNRDLRARVKEGAFREDLFFRLNVVPIEVPPLRERPADVAALAGYFARQFGATLHAEALDAIRAYPWPGNVRELRNAIERAVVLGVKGELTAADLPEEVVGGGTPARADGFHAQVEEQRKRVLHEALERCGGNQTKAAAELGLQRTYLARLVRKYGL